MKKHFLIFLLCCSTSFLQAQVQTKTIDAVTDTAGIAPPPKPTDIKAFCDCIAIRETPAATDKEYFEYGWISLVPMLPRKAGNLPPLK